MSKWSRMFEKTNECFIWMFDFLFHFVQGKWSCTKTRLLVGFRTRKLFSGHFTYQFFTLRKQIFGAVSHLTFRIIQLDFMNHFIFQNSNFRNSNRLIQSRLNWYQMLFILMYYEFKEPFIPYYDWRTGKG